MRSGRKAYGYQGTDRDWNNRYGTDSGRQGTREWRNDRYRGNTYDREGYGTNRGYGSNYRGAERNDMRYPSNRYGYDRYGTGWSQGYGNDRYRRYDNSGRYRNYGSNRDYGNSYNRGSSNWDNDQWNNSFGYRDQPYSSNRGWNNDADWDDDMDSRGMGTRYGESRSNPYGSYDRYRRGTRDNSMGYYGYRYGDGSSWNSGDTRENDTSGYGANDPNSYRNRSGGRSYYGGKTYGYYGDRDYDADDDEHSWDRDYSHDLDDED